jgi:hypothetical protein
MTPSDVLETPERQWGEKGGWNPNKWTGVVRRDRAPIATTEEVG